MKALRYTQHETPRGTRTRTVFDCGCISAATSVPIQVYEWTLTAFAYVTHEAVCQAHRPGAVHLERGN